MDVDDAVGRRLLTATGPRCQPGPDEVAHDIVAEPILGRRPAPRSVA